MTILKENEQAHFLFNVAKPSGNVVLQIEDAAIGYHNEVLSEPIKS